MLKQTEKKSIRVLVVVTLVCLYALRCVDSERLWDEDLQFLYNRCYQILDCFRHGYYPFLYYNDAGGIGYGSPIFYGQLTLFPFVFFLGSVTLFGRVYYLCCLLLNFFGMRCFLKRVSNYATLCSLFYIIGMPFVYLYCRNLQAALLGTGFSWFFFAYCVDFFRDRKHLYQVVIFFFLVYQSNMNSAIFAVLFCFCLFLMYFDKSRVKDYVRLFCCTFVLLLYNFVNIFVHIDAVRLETAESVVFGGNNMSTVLMSVLPVGEYIIRATAYDTFGVDMCCGLVSLSVLVLFVYFYAIKFRTESKRFQVCSILLLGSAVIGYAVGIYLWWPSLYISFTRILFFQFPIRYMVLLYGFVIATLSRVINYDKSVLLLLVVGLVDLAVAGPMTWNGAVIGQDLIDPISYQIGNYEYAGSKFIADWGTIHLYSSRVVSANGYNYAYINEYNGLLVDCSENSGIAESDVITLPRLYYNGYHAYGENDEEFRVDSGYSNYCQVDIGSYTGLLTLRYEVPLVVLFLFWIQVFCVSRLLYLVLKSVDWKKFLYRKQKVSEAVSG